MRKSSYQDDRGREVQVLNFEPYASVIRKPESLEVMVLDNYGYQREFDVAYRRIPGTSTFRWVVSAYKHPFRPHVEVEVSEGVAKRLTERFWHLANEYPILLLNEQGEGKCTGRAEGFVRFHEALLHGAAPSVRLLG